MKNKNSFTKKLLKKDKKVKIQKWLLSQSHPFYFTEKLIDKCTN